MINPSVKTLRSLIKNDMNILFIGESGIGKTQRMIDIVESMGLTYMYYNTPTLDPHLDFLGIPKSVSNKNDEDDHFIMLKPKELYKKNPHVIILDEINRAPKKITNALMELIQSKSINGKKLDRLKCIICSMNPTDSEITQYNVEILDPAIRDRFHSIIELSNEPDSDYFYNRFGDDGIKIVDWWFELKDISLLYASKITPRRLCYFMDMKDKFDINHIFGYWLNDNKKTMNHMFKLNNLFA